MARLQKILIPVMAFSIAIALFSFSNTREKISAGTPGVASPPFKIIMIKHAVADFDKWKAGYMAHDSVRKAYGITHFVIGRGLDDPNMVVIIDKIADVQKAKDFSMLPELKEAMQNAGVTSQPTFAYSNVIRNEDAKIEQKDRVMVAHHVKDFKTWLKGYDAEGKKKRMENGLLDRGLAQGIDDPNMVYIVFAITDMAKAKARINSDELKKLMTDAGVDGPPEIFFYKLVD